MKTILYVIVGLMAGLLLAGSIYLTTRLPAGQPVTLLPTETPPPIYVFVNGAVKHPGVYELPAEARLVEAVAFAGGFLPDADITQLNLAQKLVDEEIVTIPGGTANPTPLLTIGGSGLAVTPTPPPGGQININTATVNQLLKVSGIGPTTAQKIIDYRTANGPFLRIEDLLKVPGIGPTILAEIRDSITIGPEGEPTATDTPSEDTTAEVSATPTSGSGLNLITATP